MIIVIAIVICLLLQQGANIGGFSGAQRWINLYLLKIEPIVSKLQLHPDWSIFAVYFLPLFILIGAVNLLAIGHFYGLTHLLWLLLMMLFSIDMRDLRKTLLPRFMSIKDAGAWQKAKLRAEFLGSPKYSLAEILDYNRFISETFFIYAFENLFTPLFWLIVADSYGLIGYYLCKTIYMLTQTLGAKYNALNAKALLMKNYFEWLPMRVLAITYAVFGKDWRANFRQYLQHKLFRREVDAKYFVIDSGLHAVGIWDSSAQSQAQENAAISVLLSKSLYAWIGLVLVLFILHSIF